MSLWVVIDAGRRKWKVLEIGFWLVLGLTCFKSQIERNERIYRVLFFLCCFGSVKQRRPCQQNAPIVLREDHAQLMFAHMAGLITCQTTRNWLARVLPRIYYLSIADVSAILQESLHNVDKFAHGPVLKVVNVVSLRAKLNELFGVVASIDDLFPQVLLLRLQGIPFHPLQQNLRIYNILQYLSLQGFSPQAWKVYPGIGKYQEKERQHSLEYIYWQQTSLSCYQTTNAHQFTQSSQKQQISNKLNQRYGSCGYNSIYYMSHAYYDFSTLEEGSRQMVELIKECYANTEGKVSPDVQPGFLRHSLPQQAPEEGQGIEHLIQRTKNAIFPGLMNWQSPKYFGYYPSSINVTSVLAEMFATTFQTPSFSYAVAPSFTQLQNTMVDWSAKMLGLPEKFLLKNSGGGIINNSATESMFVSVHAAKFKKMKELGILGNNPDVLRFVGYFGEGCHVASQRGLASKDIYYKRSVPYVYVPGKRNYQLDFVKFKEIVEADEKEGLIPFWFGGSWGNTFSGAIDVNQEILQFCKDHGMWVNLDASFLGSTWICEQYRPKDSTLTYVDTMTINFTKLLLNGTGGSLFFIGEKQILNQSFGAKTLHFNFFKNHFTQNYDIVDYKDWIIGLARRNNSIKLYYTFVHYGMKKIRQSVQSNEEKALKLIATIQAHPNLFSIHASIYSIVLFQVKDKNGQVSLELTKKVAERVKNIKEGFCSPGQFQNNYVIRIVIGNFHSTQEHIDTYINKIIEVAKQEQSNA